MKPKISIVTITFNSERHLERTIASVISQAYDNKEYIVVDGCSTDGTLAIIDKYRGSIDYLISEPDSGIAEAMNKGIAAASGDYIIFLHSDDCFTAGDSLVKALPFLLSGSDIYLFDIELDYGERLVRASSKGLLWLMNFKTGVFHQSAICARSLFDRIGKFDTSLQVAMDYDFFLRCYRNGVAAELIKSPLSRMSMTGLSSREDWKSIRRRFAEERVIHFKNCSNIALKCIYMGYWPLYLLYRTARYLFQATL